MGKVKNRNTDTHLTSGSTAEILGVSHGLVRFYAERGVLARIPNGHLWLYDRASVEALRQTLEAERAKARRRKP